MCGRITQKSNPKVLGLKIATLIDQTYARNNKGMITAITSPQNGKSWAYGYDALDRLITAANSNTPAESRVPCEQFIFYP